MVVLADCSSLVQRCRALCLAAVQRRFYGPAECFFARWRAADFSSTSPVTSSLGSAESAAAAAAGAPLASSSAAWPADHFAGDVASHLLLLAALTSVILLRRGTDGGWLGGGGTLALEVVVLFLFAVDEAADILFAGALPGAASLAEVLERGFREYFAIPGSSPPHPPNTHTAPPMHRPAPPRPAAPSIYPRRFPLVWAWALVGTAADGDGAARQGAAGVLVHDALRRGLRAQVQPGPPAPCRAVCADDARREMVHGLQPRRLLLWAGLWWGWAGLWCRRLREARLSGRGEHEGGGGGGARRGTSRAMDWTRFAATAHAAATAYTGYTAHTCHALIRAWWRRRRRRRGAPR
jgi:hypothetical protein